MALTAAYSQMFAPSFKANYQASGKLRGTCMELHNLVGDSYKMKFMAQVAMDERTAYGADIPSKDPTATAPSISFTDYQLKLSIDEREQQNINASIINAYTQTHAKAMGRREDQFIIDAVVADATKTVAVGTTNLTLTKLLEAQELLGQDEVDDEIHIVAHFNNVMSLLSDEKVSSSDYNTVKTLMDARIGSYAGFTWHIVGNRTNEGGLPKTGNNRTVIAYATNAVALGYRQDPTIRVVDVPNNIRTETISFMTAGAKVGDANGVVTIICDESA